MKPFFARRPWTGLAWIPLLGLAVLVQPVRAAEYSLPLVLPAGNEAVMGFVRIVNRSNQSGEVTVRAIDDDGEEAELSLSIGANASRHFNSEDLESGNARKGLTGSAHDGKCNWRLELETDLDILPLAFVRTGDGFVTSIHDVVPEIEPGRHDVAIFNPGKNRTQQSRLRLVNPGDAAAQVEIEGTDDNGSPSEGKVKLTVPAGGACMVTSAELESGEADDDCSCVVSGDGLGAGAGKWQLSVTTGQSIQVMSVLRTPEHLTNLSTVEYTGFAPVDSAAFNARFVGRRVRATDGSGHVVDFVSSGRFTELYIGTMYEGGYTWENKGPNSGTLIFDYDDGDECTALVAFDSFITGTTLSACEDGVTEELELKPIRSWKLVETGAAPADQDAFDDLVDSLKLVPGTGLSFGPEVVFISPGRFSQGSGGGRKTGSYTFAKTGSSSGTVQLTYDGGGGCTLDLVFATSTGGSMNYTCDGASGSTNWTLEHAGVSGLAAADQDAFFERFRDKRIVVSRDPQGSFYYLDFLSRTGFREYEFGDTYEGTYTYTNTGANSADLALEYNDDDRCDVALTFRTETSGAATFVCMYDGTSVEDWQTIDRP